MKLIKVRWSVFFFGISLIEQRQDYLDYGLRLFLNKRREDLHMITIKKSTIDAILESVGLESIVPEEVQIPV